MFTHSTPGKGFVNPFLYRSSTEGVKSLNSPARTSATGSFQRIKYRYKPIFTLQEGEIAVGTIQSITPFGIFVTIGPMKCLLHVSAITGLTSRELGKRQLNRFFEIHDTIRVRIAGTAGGRISLHWIIDSEDSVGKALHLLDRFRNPRERSLVYQSLLGCCSPSCRNLMSNSFKD